MADRSRSPVGRKRLGGVQSDSTYYGYSSRDASTKVKHSPVVDLGVQAVVSSKLLEPCPVIAQVGKSASGFGSTNDFLDGVVGPALSDAATNLQKGSSDRPPSTSTMIDTKAIGEQLCGMAKESTSGDSDCTSSTDVDMASLSCCDEDDEFEHEGISDRGQDVGGEVKSDIGKDATSTGLDEDVLPEHLQAWLDGPLDGTSSLIKALASVFTHLASLGNSDVPQLTMRFHATSLPRISIYDYLLRIATGFRCSAACLVLGLVYVDRLMKMNNCSQDSQGYHVCEMNVHRLLVTSMVLAAKFHDDVFYTNQYYASIAGIHVSELQKLESELVSVLRWNLFVTQKEFSIYLHSIFSSGKADSCKSA